MHASGCVAYEGTMKGTKHGTFRYKTVAPLTTRKSSSDSDVRLLVSLLPITVLGPAIYGCSLQFFTVTVFCAVIDFF